MEDVLVGQVLEDVCLDFTWQMVQVPVVELGRRYVGSSFIGFLEEEG